jgi:nitrite reductase (NADH) small subunit
MSDFQTIARVGDIPTGEGRCFVVGGKLVAVFLVDGEYHALNDTCPHMGASLAEGYVEEGAVYCPWHAWRFCVKEGTWLDSPKSAVRTQTYDVRVSGQEIQVCVPAEEASTSGGAEDEARAPEGDN